MKGRENELPVAALSLGAVSPGDEPVPVFWRATGEHNTVEPRPE